MILKKKKGSDLFPAVVSSQHASVKRFRRPMLKHNYRDKPAAFWSHDPIWSERSKAGDVTGYELGSRSWYPPPLLQGPQRPNNGKHKHPPSLCDVFQVLNSSISLRIITPERHRSITTTPVWKIAFRWARRDPERRGGGLHLWAIISGLSSPPSFPLPGLSLLSQTLLCK